MRCYQNGCFIVVKIIDPSKNGDSIFGKSAEMNANGKTEKRNHFSDAIYVFFLN